MLTNKQNRFVLEYLQDLNATQAAIRAGYSKKSANWIGKENLQKQEIKEAIQKKLEEIESNKTASIKEIMEYWTSVMRGEAKEETLYFVGKGEQQITTISANANVRIKASENLAKALGLFNDKKEESERSDMSKLDELLSKIDDLAEEPDDET